MIDFSKLRLVKQGICLYDGLLEYKVVIAESDILYGADDDYEDPPEVKEDRVCRCYYVGYDSPHARDNFMGGSAFFTIEEAVAAVEKETYFAYWIEE